MPRAKVQGAKEKNVPVNSVKRKGYSDKSTVINDRQWMYTDTD